MAQVMPTAMGQMALVSDYTDSYHDTSNKKESSQLETEIFGIECYFMFTKEA